MRQLLRSFQSILEFNPKQSQAFLAQSEMDQCKQTNHHYPEEDSGKPCQGLEEPVADGRLVVGGESELLGQALQVFYRLSGHVVEIHLKTFLRVKNRLRGGLHSTEVHTQRPWV